MEFGHAPEGNGKQLSILRKGSDRVRFSCLK